MSENHALPSAPRVCSRNSFLAVTGLAFGFLAFTLSVASIAYQRGAAQPRFANFSEAVLHATATHGGTNVAVATGQISEETEGLFILDYVTGNLQCWVYYGRFGRFGGKFEINIGQQLPATKNAEYLLVIGESITPQASGNIRPAPAICYVVDTKSGMFAGYSVPWNRSMETGGQPQTGPLVFVAGDQFRAPAGGSTTKKAISPATKETGKEKAPAAK